MNLPSKSLPLPSAYYDKNSGGYWYQDAQDTWLRLKEGDFVRFLKDQGNSAKPNEGETQSAVDRCLMDIQMKQNVDYAGPLAGYREGLIAMEGKAILVTEEPKMIEPTPGDYKVLQAVLVGMLGDEQLPYFQGWCKIAYESLASGDLRPGQALVLAGPRESGKSLVQGLITKMLGGRSAHPYLHMAGGTAFNSELFGAEHLIIDDQVGQSDFKHRLKLTAAFKNITAAGSQQCHPKGKPALTLKPFWRLSVSVNDDAESLMVLPLVKEDVADKMMLFKVERKAMPMPTAMGKERQAFEKHLWSELPHWLHFLLNWKIPAELIGNRYGVKHYHHPEIIEAIDGLSPERTLYDLLETQFTGYPHGWEGTAEALENLLAGDGATAKFEARKLFTFHSACATYLGRLAKKHPQVITKENRRKDRRYWKIVFPKTSEGVLPKEGQLLKP